MSPCARARGALAARRSTSRAWRWRSSRRWYSRKRCTARCARPRRLHETEQFLPFAYLLTALLFAARASTRRARCGPGCRGSWARSSRSPVVALIFAVVSGEHFSSYYLFYGSLAFAVLYVASAAALYERLTRVAAARRRLPAPRGAGRHRQAHPRRRPRAVDAPHSPIEVVGFLSPRSLPANGCARWARWRPRRACSAASASTR